MAKKTKKRKPKLRPYLHCAICGKELSEDQSLFATAWDSLYWCGEADCAFLIMDSECREVDYDDPDNYE